MMAMGNSWPCHLVYHGDKKEFEKGRGNAGLVKFTGAETEFVEVEQISSAMDRAMEKFKKAGLKPYYVHGGGHDMPGGIAFVEAIKELKQQSDTNGYKPDYIFMATGTGSTQAGIAVGLDLVGWSDVKLIGISVARSVERGKIVVVDFANELAKHYGMEKNYTDKIIFLDDYIGKGYDEYSKELSAFIRRVYKQTRLLVDATYSGKALFGMTDYIKKNQKKGNFLFWQTGGPVNAIN